MKIAPENFGVANKTRSLPLREALNYARLTETIGFQALSDITETSWYFTIRAEESNDEGCDQLQIAESASHP